MASLDEAGNSNSKSTNGAGLKYQGRKTSRANSEQRRRTILEAALRIVVRDGVRGVRHRAVAKEAEVPLSATTYYFKDISDLITDTFTLFVEMGADKFKIYWEEADSQLQAAVGTMNHPDVSREQLAGRLTDLVVEYVLVQLREHRSDLIAERAFQLECLRNENLRPIAFNHQAFFLNSLEAFFVRVGSSEPRVDAHLFSAVIQKVEYEGLISSNLEVGTGMIRKMLKRQLTLIIK
ncbi:TetR family transcriptional regulator [Endozoicomonas sp. (ex Bugula neritina AB1)]|nr:TetR family transcriptional regulator [Endozoicomonas sp. (ex Bugula neritina AB1)]